MPKWKFKKGSSFWSVLEPEGRGDTHTALSFHQLWLRLPGPLAHQILSLLPVHESAPPPKVLGRGSTSVEEEGAGEGLGTLESWRESQICHLLSVWLQATYLPFRSKTGATELLAQVPPARLRAWDAMGSCVHPPILEHKPQ